MVPGPTSSLSSTTSRPRPSSRALSALLFVATWVLYSGALTHDFLDLDDVGFVTENAIVLEGLTWDGVVWAFANPIFANWTPLAMVSHMIDVELFGLDPAGHHAMAITLHALAASLWFVAWRQWLGDGKAFFVAAVFATHPQHVESVAWVSERRDVLCAVFFAATVALWLNPRVRATGVGRALVTLTGVFAMLAKPLAVTLPFVLLLVDVFALERLRVAAVDLPRTVVNIVGEKLGLVLASVTTSIFTITAQQPSVASDIVTLSTRLQGALSAWGHYVATTFWPSRLVAFWPRPDAWPTAGVVGGLVVVTAGSLVAVVLRRRRAVPLGWLWFLVVLVPMLGLVQVGDQAWADRYMYVPSIGLTLVVVGAFDGAPLRVVRALPALAVVAVLALAIRTTVRVPAWRSTPTLFQAAVDDGVPSWRALSILARERREAGDLDGAEALLRQSLTLRADDPVALEPLAFIRFKRGDLVEARALYERLLEHDATVASVQHGYGLTLLAAGDRRLGTGHIGIAIRLEPRRLGYRVDLARALVDGGEHARALAVVDDTMAMGEPASPGELVAFGRIAVDAGDPARALALFRAAQTIAPSAVEPLAWMTALLCGPEPAQDLAAADASLQALTGLVGREHPVVARLSACVAAGRAGSAFEVGDLSALLAPRVAPRP